MDPSPLFRRSDQPFHFCQIDETLARRLVGLIERRDSAVLLGPRDLGKSYFLRRLGRRLRLISDLLVVEVTFPRLPALADAEAIRRLIRSAVVQALQGFPPQDPGATELLSPIVRACEQQRRLIVLLASHVDSLAHHQAQLLLREMRTLILDRRLAVVLTGEENLRDLVTGPDSDFNCAEQFVVQGFGEAEFHDYLAQRNELQQIDFADRRGALSALFRASAGNVFLAKAVIRGWLELSDRGRPPAPSPVVTLEFEKFLDGIPYPETFDLSVFAHLGRAIERAPRTLEELCMLLNAGRIPAGAVPSELELGGLAVRGAGLLRFASPMVERFVRNHYDNCRLGDLHAFQGDWETALTHYRKLSEERRLRPCGADDRLQITMVIKSLSSALHAEATRRFDPAPEESGRLAEIEEKLSRVKALFVEACKFTLGFSELAFWTCRQSHEQAWTRLGAEPLSAAAENIGRAALRHADTRRLGWQDAPEALRPHIAMAVLPSLRPDHRDAVTIADLHQRADISRERRTLLKELVEQFTIAYHHTIANLGIAFRLKTQEQQLRIAAEIVGALADAACKPSLILERAGDALLDLGYRCVMFSLVDAAHTAIHGSVTRPPPATDCDIAHFTHFRLSEPDKDIQPYVAVRGKHEFVSDWRTQVFPPVQKELSSRANMGPFAVLPMFLPLDGVDGDGNPREEIFGTMHVERNDGKLPSEDDLEDLKTFGRLIATAVSQSERIHALIQTLDHENDAVLILDRQQNLTFANPVAARRLDVEAGFHHASRKLRLGGAHRILLDQIQKVLDTGKRSEYSEKSNSGTDARRDAVEIEPLSDWRVFHENIGTAADQALNRTIGASVQIRDLSGLERVLKAVESIASRAIDRESVLDAVVESAELLRCRRARLYLATALDANLLVSTRHLGLDAADGEKFNEGGFSMDRRDTVHFEISKCLAPGMERACVFRWESGRSPGDLLKNEAGLEVFAIPEPASFAVWNTTWKNVGDYWVDLPLLVGSRIIGKLTLECPADLTPHELDLLNIFAELLGPVIDAPERWIRSAVDETTATVAHKIKTRFASLSALARKYQEAAPGNEEVKRMSETHEEAVRATMAIIHRIGRTLKHAEVHRTPTNVATLLNDVIKFAQADAARFGSAKFTVECAEEWQFPLDGGELTTALLEMMDNSRSMKGGGKLEIVLAARIDDSGPHRTLILTVRDNGPGISPGRRGKIFAPFFSHRPYGGQSSGLGLSLVARIVEAHGGGIRLAPSAEPGATFIIEIPEDQSKA
jgi:signal transduction histidine kinase/PAS domain-containing protein